MRVVVTGGCGFIGSYVANHLAATGHQVVVIDRMAYAADEARLHPSQNLTLVKADLNDGEALLRTLRAHEPDTVIHMAAQTHVDRSFDGPHQFVHDNISATLTLLECCREYGSVKRFVHMSTDEVYGDVPTDHAGCVEDTAVLHPTNPYSASKAGAEHMCTAYRMSYGLPIVMIRCNNVYGPTQYPEKLVPKFTRLLADGKRCPIQGDGTALRSFVHARDVARAIALIARDGIVGEAYNIGTANEFSVRQIFERILEMVRPGADPAKWCAQVADRPYNDKRYAVDDTKLRALGWREEEEFDLGLLETVRDELRAVSPSSLRWLVYGSRGWIGQQLVALLEAKGHTVIAGTARADDDDAVARELDAVKPDRVFCLVGRTHGGGCATIDYLEHPDRLVENVTDNLYSPLHLALACGKRDIHFSYLGTGCIFSYNDATPASGYDAAARPDFFGSNYSIVKGFTDRLMHHVAALNLRIRMPIVGHDSPRNFVTKIRSYAKVVDIPNSMTVLPELLPVAIDLAVRKSTGTVNLTNPGAISHNEILTMYRDLVDPTFAWENFSEAEQNLVLKSKRSNNLLDTSRLEKEYPGVLDIHSSMRKLFEEWSG